MIVLHNAGMLQLLDENYSHISYISCGFFEGGQQITISIVVLYASDNFLQLHVFTLANAFNNIEILT